jgi:integrase
VPRRVDYLTRINKLTAAKIKKLTKPGRYSDGGNLFVVVRPNGSKYFTFLFNFHGRQTEVGIGNCERTSLDEARARADEGRALLRAGKNPKLIWQAEQRAQNVPTFAAAADDYLTAASKGWRSERHVSQVKSLLEKDCKPIAGKLINQITCHEVQAVIEALNKRAPTTARRLGGTLEEIFERARLRGYIDAHKRNPAEGVTKLLGDAPDAEHHAAMPDAKLPAFVETLRARRQDKNGSWNVTALALEFLILTGTRRGQAANARWADIDLEQRLWTTPAQETKQGKKTGKDDPIPLSDGAMVVIELMMTLRRPEHAYVFPGTVPGKPVSGKSFERLMARLGCKGEAVVHGMRTTLRGWAKKNRYPFELCEEALSHKVGTAVTRAYDREKAIEQLRDLFAAWDRFLQPKPANVVPLRAA